MPIHCVRNRIFPSRYYPDPRLSLYALPFNDGEGGKLRNHITGELATLAGGSTLLTNEKYRNDFQRLTSDFPTLGYRASGAYTNLDYALDPDNPSAEGGTAGTHTATNGGITVITTDSWHGSHCFKQTPTGAAPTFDTDLMAVTAASTQYTTAAMVKATAGRTIRASLIGDTSGATNGDFTATGEWQLVYVTKTFAAGDTTSRDRSILLTDGIAGDTFLVDAVITVAGSTVPMFEESECVATSATFPTPITAGDDASGIIFLWIPEAMGATNRVHLDLLDSNAGIQIEFLDSRLVFSCQNGTAGKAKLWTAAIAPGFHRIAWSRHDTGTDIELRLAVDGVLATADGTPRGSGDDQFYYPSGITTDGTHIWVADANNHRIVKRDAATLAYVSKIGSLGSGDDQFYYPWGITTDGTHIWVADRYNHRIVKRDAATLAYVSKIGSLGSGDDQFYYPSGITTDGTHIWVADTSNHRIVKRSADDLSYISKIGTLGSGNDQFYSPFGIATDGNYIWVADTYNHRIVKRSADDLSYISKIGTLGSGNDQFYSPFGIATDGNYIWVADRYNHRIVKRDAATLAYVSKIGSLGSGDDQFSYPRGITTDGTHIWVADANNNRIVKRLAADALTFVSESPQATSFEATLPATLSLPNSGNCVQLQYWYKGVAWGDEECQYYSSLQAPPPMYRRVG